MSSQPPSTIPFTINNVIQGMRAFPDSPGLYRIFIHPEHAAAAGGATVKYLAAPNSSRTLTGPNAHNILLGRLAFDRLPAGSWIVGHLAEDDTPNPSTPKGHGKLHLLSTVPAPDTPAALTALGLCTAEPLWCGTTVPEIACRDPPGTDRWTTIIHPATGAEVCVPKPTDLQCMDYHSSASVIPAPPGLGVVGEVVYVQEWLPGHWQGIENEAGVFRVIQEREPGLAPRLLAHVVENGQRVIGFLLERVVGVREAGIADLEVCKGALERLHALGITKGKLSRHAFLVREGCGSSVMIQGSFGFPAENPEEQERVMKAEMESLERVLSESPSAFEDRAARELRLLDPQRTKLLDEFQEAHGLVLPFVFWQESREGGGRITLTLEQHGVLVQQFEANGYRWTKELQEMAQQRFGPALKASDGPE